MSSDDKKRWNEKYTKSLLPQNTLKVLEEYASRATGKKALDIACGMGRNSRYLAKEGFDVHAIDISEVAIASLEGLEHIHTEIVDLDTYRLKENAYDLIVCTYFLERKLFPQMKVALKEDGILIFETFMHHKENTKVPSNRAFLLEEDELIEAFEDTFEIVHYESFMDKGVCGDKNMKVSMVAQKSSSKIKEGEDENKL